MKCEARGFPPQIESGIMIPVKIRMIKSAPLKRGTSFLVRADFDVPVKGSVIQDDFRIQRCVETIRYLLERGSAVHIIAHLGRPDGIRHARFSMRPVAVTLERLLRHKVAFVEDPLNRQVLEAHRNNGASRNAAILFENIRFWKEEQANDTAFAARLAEWGDCYVNEAFADAHRKHASVWGIPALLPSYAGFNFSRELEVLSSIVHQPKRPFVAMVGGGKIETKAALIAKLVKYADTVIVGGAVANALLWMRGVEVGRSVRDGIPTGVIPKRVLWHKRLLLPHDAVTARSPGSRKKLGVREVTAIPEDEAMMDIGPESSRRFIWELGSAATIVWNGPMGLAETRAFSGGTRSLVRHLQGSRAFKVVGGGDTVGLLRRWKLTDAFDHVSTGGGAMIAYLGKERLPGVEALARSSKAAATR